MSSRRLSLVAIVLVLLTAVGCNRREVYMHYEPTDVSGWERKDTLRFDVPPLAEASTYTTTLHVRTTTSTPYPFTKLYVEVAQRWPDSCFVDTIECAFDDQDFSSTGISVRQYTFPVRSLPRAAGDSAHITLRHVMRQTSVSGISDLGLSLE